MTALSVRDKRSEQNFLLQNIPLKFQPAYLEPSMAEEVATPVVTAAAAPAETTPAVLDAIEEVVAGTGREPALMT